MTTLTAPASGEWPVTATATDAAGNAASAHRTLDVQRVFDVSDFGATGDDDTVDSAAINAAIQACHDAGGGTVYIPKGVYLVTGDHTNPSVGAIELLSNVNLVGAGMGQTVLKLVDDFNDRINGIVRTTLGQPGETVENVGLSDLTIDGNRAHNTGHQAAFISGAKDDGSGRIQKDITINRVEAMNCTAYGFDPHEITTNIVIENSVAHGNGLDGFVADYLVDSNFHDNVAYDNDRHGFNVQNQTTNFVLANNVAYGNGVGAAGGSGVTVQRGDVLPDGETSIPPDSHVTIIGGEYYDNSRSGILIKLADTVTVDGADVHDNAREGIRVEGAPNTVSENSKIHDNSTEAPGTYDAVNIRVRDDVPFNQTVYSTNTSVHDNDIYATTSASRYGIREEVTNATLPDGSSSGTTLTDDAGTTASDNTISGMASGDVSVPGYAITISGTDAGETLQGTANADRIDGKGGDDRLYGYAGTDTLIGGSGDDLLDGGSNADKMAGGTGDDTYYVDHTGDVVTENPGEGTDTVCSTITYTLGDNVENLTLLGSDPKNGYGNALDNVLIGNDGANVLKGMDGNDTLDGGLGADTMTGGSGDDTYYVDNVGDVINESQDNGAGGYDRVFSSVSYTLPDQVEALTLTGTADLNATGNAGSNALTGNAGNNVLDGGAGADTMSGGLGDDTYYVDHTGDVVVEGLNAGTDTVDSTINTTLGDNVENLTLLGGSDINGYGNALANVLIGNAGANVLKGMDGNDTLDGGLGADTMVGGSGDDTYYVDNLGDIIDESQDSGAGGYDRVFSSVSYTLP
ncbi:glycosyl hydrolase family 28-related protein, partial [Jatrophihabitans endophyticus]|uniref:right-handed parallel beta-helix repeat-containing protein n=1 Tax=Jatrophihabitans endophyticus TaxID=1206085 RepID=UPI0019FDC6DE